ncbi:MAG: WecB/TagA/CpsF family glycosyltransferase [Blautia sp.]|nr:WecB/TagA/CpsF family glycosyltransferase [Blautia sp.]MDD7371449.1 WecB/TagA/CpsF family glycosyltransferase [Bacillota bacterium]MDY3714233.1 WecB/TagA/CpsF family glycosyltransferase [Blautia sp.]
MDEKIQVLGISVEKCYVDEVMDNINENWNREDVLATYGVINMKLLMAAQKDEQLRAYIDALDKAAVDEPEVLHAAGMSDARMEEEVLGHSFFGALFWYLSYYQNQIFLLGENEKDTEEFYSYVKGKYPQIVILGKGNLEECEKDEFDKIINEINALTPQAVLGCSKNFGIERFVQEHRKKINTRVFFCLGQCEEIRKESGVKKTWLEKLLEKNSFKKMVSQYKEGTEKGEG